MSNVQTETLLRKFPLPGDSLFGMTVIASVWSGDEHALVLLVRKSPPYFEVAQFDLRPHGNLVFISDHFNIVPAVVAYQENGGDY